MRRDESGQALAFGAVLLVTLALGMYLIADFGNHVREKIHVQTVVDSTAFSLATMEAQSFNFVAFTNRAQVTHYVTMMNMQAWVSWASLIEHGLVFAANLAYAVGEAARLIPQTAGEGQQLMTLAETMRTLATPVTEALDALELLDEGSFSALSGMNSALWAAQMTMTNMVNLHLMSGGVDVFNAVKNDPDWNPDFTPSLILGNWAALKYQTAFSTAGGFPGPFGWSSPLKDDPNNESASNAEVARLQRAMTNVINATRFDKQLVNRSPLPIPKFDVVQGALTSLSHVPGVGAIASALNIDPLQSTRLVGAASIDDRANLDQIFVADNDSTRGQTLASSDVWLWGKGGVWASATNGGTSGHCRVVQNSYWKHILDIPALLLDPMRLLVCKPKAQDSHHNWKGIAPYMALAAARTSNNPVESLALGDRFHQPDVVVYITKDSPNAGFAKGYNVTWTQESVTAHVQTGYGHSMPIEYLSKGIHGIARAQAYYHRPGNWQEPPNLWNPYWHARLMPIFPDISPDSSSNPAVRFVRQLLPVPVVYH